MFPLKQRLKLQRKQQELSEDEGGEASMEGRTRASKRSRVEQSDGSEEVNDFGASPTVGQSSAFTVQVRHYFD